MIFISEEGHDTGGLTREFFRLIAYTISTKYLDSAGCFKHDAIAYQVINNILTVPNNLVHYK